MSKNILEIAKDVAKGKKVKVKTTPKTNAQSKEIVDTLDAEDTRISKAGGSGKLFQVLAGLLIGDLFGVAGASTDQNADGKKIADRYLDENSQKHLFKALGKALNVAALAPVGDTDKESKCFNPLKNTWGSCEDSGAPKKRLRAVGVGRQKERKTGGRVRGANQGKRGGKTTV